MTAGALALAAVVIVVAAFVAGGAGATVGHARFLAKLRRTRAEMADELYTRDEVRLAAFNAAQAYVGALRAGKSVQEAEWILRRATEETLIHKGEPTA